MVRFNRPARIAVSVLTLSIASTLAHADIAIEERISLQGTGFMSLANMNGRSITTISGKNARMESDMQMQSRLARVFARDAATADIVRLEDDKVYQLDLKKKSYTESSLAEQRAQLEKILEQQRQAQAQQQQTGTGVDESQCEWLPPQVEVNRTGEKATFAGFDSERVTITAVQSCKVKNTNQVCDFALAMDQWVTPDFDGDSEAIAFHRAYAEKMGFNAATSRDFAERAEAMFGRYKDMWTELAAKLMDVKGYPVKSSIGFGMGGPQCQDAQAQAQQSPMTGMGGITGQIGGALGGLFGKKKKQEDAAAASTQTASAALPNGVVPLMTLSSELVSVTRAPADRQLFEVPTDFKKVENQ
jgi:hypothetical protein